ncbi:MAG TPA: YifB family Mg chelatase-like AAA ATPase [Acidimicrobiia bacterium]|nr:YifB family Mg chelatase-like AAA ATPase [Acidimicrobiia bacterium]
MFAQAMSVAMVGAEPRPVRIEAHVGRPIESFSLVGLPDTSVREAKQRVRAAILSTGQELPHRQITVNLSPADLPKAGSDYDLPIALGVLAASRVIPNPSRMIVAGELALDGTVRRSRWAIGAALLAVERGWPCLVSEADAPTAARVPGSQVFAISSLAEATAVVSGGSTPRVAEARVDEVATDEVDLAEVRGQPVARRALEIAAAGGHHLLMIGSPGCGKTMLAQRLPTILPPLEPAEAVEVACLWASADRRRPLTSRPPFRAPHHSASMAAVVGGGSPHPQPGEVSLAHGGVLFLDELGEFPPHLLNALRQPIEEGAVTIARRGRSITFPARAQVVAASNPCPCGFRGDRIVSCRCSPVEVARYRGRLTGPFLDRFDLRLHMTAPDPDLLLGSASEDSATVKDRVLRARKAQLDRSQRINSALSRNELDALVFDGPALDLVAAAVRKGALTGRGADRVRRMARTIADLADSETVDEVHVGEALSYRGAI